MYSGVLQNLSILTFLSVDGAGACECVTAQTRTDFKTDQKLQLFLL